MLAVLAEDASSVGKVVFPAFLWPSRPPAGLEARASFEAGRGRILQPASTARGGACTRGVLAWPRLPGRCGFLCVLRALRRYAGPRRSATWSALRAVRCKSLWFLLIQVNLTKEWPVIV